MQEFVEQVQLEMKKAHEIARQTLQGSQMWQKRDDDIHSNASTYAIVDVVLLMNSASKVGQCRKLTALWKGPFVIRQVLSPTRLVMAHLIVLNFAFQWECSDCSAPPTVSVSMSGLIRALCARRTRTLEAKLEEQKPFG